MGSSHAKLAASIPSPIAITGEPHGRPQDFRPPFRPIPRQNGEAEEEIRNQKKGGRRQGKIGPGKIDQEKDRGQEDGRKEDGGQKENRGQENRRAEADAKDEAESGAEAQDRRESEDRADASAAPTAD
jgi:hypothetical protein